MRQLAVFSPTWINFFTRPCPYFLERCNTFPQFSKLPAELQIRIWRLAELNPRTLQLVPMPLLPPANGLGIQIFTSIPSTFTVSWDAREAALKEYRPAVRNFSPRHPPVWFHHDRDQLALDFTVFCFILHHSTNNPQIVHDLTPVKRLFLGQPRQLLNQNCLAVICRYFPNLEELDFLEVGVANNRAGIPSLFQPGDSWPRDSWDSICQYITSPMALVRPALVNWTPPVVKLGSISQWKNEKKGRRDRQMGKEGLERAERGNMDWVPTVTFPSLDFVPAGGRVNVDLSKVYTVALPIII